MKPPSKNKLVIFVKAPRLGMVKSRLAASIGNESACSAYKKMVEHLMGNLRGLADVEIRFSPDDAEVELREWLGGHFIFARQGFGDLGEKLHRAFQENFAAGAERVVVIGSDCPYVTVQDIEMAWNILATHDVVLGPATDGGYWLIGLRAEQAALFQNMPWSSETLFAKTVEKIGAASLTHFCLRELSDIDTETEWNCFLRHVS